MKILKVVEQRSAFKNTNNIGGYLSHVVGVTEAFKRLGHEVHIASFGEIPYLNKTDYIYHYLQDDPVSFPLIRGLTSQRGLVREIIKIIRNCSPDLLYLRWTGNLFINRIKKLYPELPIVVECNGVREMSAGGRNLFARRYMRLYDKQYVENATVISAITDVVKNFVLEHHPQLSREKIFTNPNGVDVEKFRYVKTDLKDRLGIPADMTVVGFAGVFMPWQKIEDLIQAVQNLGTETRLLLIGEGKGEYVRNLESLAAEKNNERIIFTGLVSHTDIPKYLSVCDILVVTQSKERPIRSPIKLFEYMATGRAIAVANVGQLSEIIKDGENGLTFEPNTHDLGRVLDRLIQNKELREKIGEKARRDAVQQYTWDANVTRILDKIAYISLP